MTIVDATEAFGSELRLRLIRHYADHPGSQAAAAAELGLNSGTVARNTQALVRLGVVEESLDPDNRRARLYRVKYARYRELVDALHGYVVPPETKGSER